MQFVRPTLATVIILVAATLAVGAHQDASRGAWFTGCLFG